MAAVFVGKYQPGAIHLVCRKTGDRYALIEAPDGVWYCYCNECFLVTRPTRIAAIDWAEKEANISLSHFRVLKTGEY